MYALKIAKNQEVETLDSFAKEKLKDNIYKKYGVPHASIIESSSNMILKEWIEGVRADDFFKNWSSTGASQSAPELIAFKKFFYKLAESGIYIGDLNAKNLIWSKGKWIIVDSGGIKEGLTHDKALSEYLKKIPLKMEKHLSPSCLSTFNNFFED
jgi:predicted unusual protein kinase regulating ubiquinone biosynthesis (AarF/ABC1/UbiB family)